MGAVDYVPADSDYSRFHNLNTLAAEICSDTMGAVDYVPADSDYSRFHNLNTLAAEICSFNGEARIMK